MKNFVRDVSLTDSPVIESTQDKKGNRQKAAQDRHKLAPVTKKIRQLEVLIAQLEGQLKEVENKKEK